MSNNLEKVIPQLLAQGLMTLRENCVMPRLVNSDYDALAAQKGASIDVPIPSAIQANDVNPGVTAPDTGDLHPDSVNIPLDQWKEAPFHLTDKDQLECLSGTIPMQAEEAIKALANVVDKYLLNQYKKIPGTAGVAGTTPFASTAADATACRTILNKQLAPLTDRRMVLDPDAEGAALNLQAFQDTSWAGDSSVIKSGMLTPKLGFVWHMDQNVPTHTAGTLADGTLNGDVTASTTTPVYVVNIASTAGGTLVAGDVISFAGSDIPYAVAADVTIGAASNADVLLVGAVREDLSDTAAVSVIGDHVVNLAFHRDCIAFATRPLADSASGLGNIIQSAVDPKSGLSLRLEVSREHKRTRFSYDILYGGQMVRADLGCRLLG